MNADHLTPLFWIEIQFYAINSWWNMTTRNMGEDPDRLILWHPLPVVARVSNFLLIHHPPQDFIYQNRKINSYIGPRYRFDWVSKNHYYHKHLEPHPCAQCGWYCNQFLHP